MAPLIIVVPCYNEARRLDVDAFLSFRSEPEVRFLFVDDGSTDETAAVLEDLRQHDPPRFALHRLERNRGKAEAVRHGILAALDQHAAYAGFWDADLATPLEAIEGFCAVLEARPEIEMVFGSRVNLLGHDVQRRRTRHYLGRVFATLASTVLRLPVYDTQCGAKLFRVNRTLRAIFEEPFLSRWIFDVEIIARLSAERRGSDRPPPIEVICEQPLARWHDVGGSKLRPRDMLVILADLVRIQRRYFAR